jgi:MHS family shikimate/dehydroshikimate transporter-like MFS transporter
MRDVNKVLSREPLGESTAAQTPGTARAWIVAATVIGTTIEWYDFFIYGTAAALVFNKVFFPSFDPAAGTIAAFATFAIGLLARPFGGIVFGHFGDRFGRKSTLMVSLLLMGIPTTLIGLVPAYKSIGLWAAAILVTLRLLQGLALGGEWGGAVLMAVEHAPKARRVLFGALPQAGAPAGLLIASLTFALVGHMPEASFIAWGWRLPFLLSIVLVAVGVLVRWKVAESPAFITVLRAGKTVDLPGVEVVRRYWRTLLLTIGAKLGEVTLFYLVTVFTLSYATTKLGIPRQQALNAIMIAAGLACGTIPLFGVLGDRFGQRRMFALGGLYLALFAVPMFWMIDSRDPTHSHRNSLLRCVPGLSGCRGDRRWPRADLGDIASRAFRDESADRSLPRWSRSACGYLCRIDAAGPTRCFVVD